MEEKQAPRCRDLIDRLEAQRWLPEQDMAALIAGAQAQDREYLFERARQVTAERFGDGVFTWGLIEFSSYCSCDCYYCGLRHGNGQAQRYRLENQEILDCCGAGYSQGLRTFVLQSGEDPWWTCQRVVDLVKAIKSSWPDSTLVLSVGERDRQTFQAWFDAGADGYLMRHETANAGHYRQLHPSYQTPENRRRCLKDLKEIGYLVASGFMVGSPGQRPDLLAQDLAYLKELKPQVVGIGPFVPQDSTPFGDRPGGSLDQALLMLGLLRLMDPGLLLPATTALEAIDPKGLEKGILAGGNVLMANISPLWTKDKYVIYQHKPPCAEAVDALAGINSRLASIGRRSLYAS